MFISTERPIVIPQSEHLRLAGILAHKWGNSRFRLPKINRESFVLGVATHDRAFGFLDTAEVGKLSVQERSAQVQMWLDTAYTNPEAELIVLLHVRRLLNAGELGALYEKLDARIRDVVNENNLSLIEFEHADTITGLCDGVSFDFCFEYEIERTRSVFAASDKMIELTYKIKDHKITLDPWPFSVSVIEDYILGYEQSGYPKELQPVMLEFTVHSG